jgi:hypothetical protein
MFVWLKHPNANSSKFSHKNTFFHSFSPSLLFFLSLSLSLSPFLSVSLSLSLSFFIFLYLSVSISFFYLSLSLSLSHTHTLSLSLSSLYLSVVYNCYHFKRGMSLSKSSQSTFHKPSWCNKISKNFRHMVTVRHTNQTFFEMWCHSCPHRRKLCSSV